MTKIPTLSAKEKDIAKAEAKRKRDAYKDPDNNSFADDLADGILDDYLDW